MGEGAAAEEAPVGGQGAGVGGFQDQTWGSGADQGFLLLCLCAPEHKGHGLGQAVQGGDDAIGKALPAPGAVAVGLATLYGENSI